MSPDVLQVPDHRRAQLASIIAGLRSASHVLLSTHVNADGDGIGSEAAIASWLATEGKRVSIVNPTPVPSLFRRLIQDEEWIADPDDTRLRSLYSSADALLVLDTGEPRRIGKVFAAASEKPTCVLDHHQPSDPGFQGTLLIDPAACATGELVYDLLIAAGAPEPWPPNCAEGIYTAIVTDTGSFRFSNTTFRAHAIAGDMIRRGVDPEETYKKLFATVPLRRVQLLRAALDNLQVDPDLPITWLSVPRAVMIETGATPDDLEGLVDHARSVEGTEVALLFRETADGATKVSLRSNGNVDVNAIARQFGGGGHIKASGAVLPGDIETVSRKVLAATRRVLAGLRA